MPLLNEHINAYKALLSGLENKTGTNRVMVIIAVFTGIVTGCLLSRH